MNPNLQRIMMAARKNVFSPLDIADLELWVDAADSSTIIPDGVGSSLISQVLDKSANSYVGQQTTSGSRPSYGTQQINGLDTIHFTSGSAKFLRFPSALYTVPANDYTVFTVMKFNNINNFNRIYNGYSGSGNTFSLVAENSAGRIAAYNNSNFSNAAAISPITTNAQILCVSLGGTTIQASRNGTPGTNGTAFKSNCGVFEFSSSADALYGLIGEYVLYRRNLSTIEKNVVGNYLSNKWGISWTDL